MNTIHQNRETNQKQTLKNKSHLFDRDLMNDLSDLEELDVWSTDDLRDVLTPGITSLHSEFDYGWDDSLSIYHTHSFQD